MILGPLQGMNSFTRKFGSHVERENMDWRVSFGMEVQMNDLIQILFKTLPSNHRAVRGVRAREFQSISCFNDVTRISLASLTHATKK